MLLVTTGCSKSSFRWDNSSVITLIIIVESHLKYFIGLAILKEVKYICYISIKHEQKQWLLNATYGIISTKSLNWIFLKKMFVQSFWYLTNYTGDEDLPSI